MEQLQIDSPSRLKKIPYPKGVFFIMATELSERFSYYGMRAVLTIYMRNILSFSEDQSTAYYHGFLMLCYGLPIFWGVISDSWLGKFKTILYVSILFALGNIVLTISSIPPLHLPTRELFFAGLLLMAIGTAGMKPCVAPLGGEQFEIPQQNNQLKHFFSIFFFVVTIGNMISTVITPIFRRDVSCFEMETCYPLAFGVPATIMIFAILIFSSGKRLYRIQEPKGNMLVKVSKCVAHALTNRKRKSRSLTDKSHWLDAASDLYDEGIIQDTKGLFRVLPYFLPVPMFFALYEQLGSRWTLQATRMDGRIGHFSIKPDQMQVSNAILMFISLPMFNWIVYPLLAKCGLNLRPLQKMVIGGILASMSFAVAGIVEMRIEPSIRLKPTEGKAVLSVVNAVHCPATLYIDPGPTFPQNFSINPQSTFILPHQKFPDDPFPISISFDGEKCIGEKSSHMSADWNGYVTIKPSVYQTISISEVPDGSLVVEMMPFEDDYKKSKDGNARVRFIVVRDPSGLHLPEKEETKVILTPTSGDTAESYTLFQKDNLFYSETEEIDENEYDVTLHTPRGTASLTSRKKLNLVNGGSYNLIIYDNGVEKGFVKSQLATITPPNSVHILWLLPQYILMAWGEILFIVSGMEFAYTEAPPSMRSVVQAVWHLMNAVGNVIVILSAQNHGHRTQALDFFLFAGFMFLDAIVYGFMAVRYKYVNLESNQPIFH